MFPVKVTIPSPWVKINANSEFKDNDDDKTKILNIIENKYNETQALSDESIGNKNLLYFAVYGKNYSNLLELCLKSIAFFNSNFNFDVLIITDVNGQELIKDKEVTKKFNLFYHIIETPSDGIEASKTKTQIFNFPKINEYNKILFIDADFLCVGDINYFFSLELNNNFFSCYGLLTRYPEINFKQIPINFNSSPYHNLDFFLEKDRKRVVERDYKGFNAGQFLFRNTERMQGHFKNVNWLMNVWPGKYFFEQSFLNYYFVINDLVKYDIFDDKINFLYILDGTGYKEPTKKRHGEEDILLHFSGSPIDGAKKLNYIKTYITTHNLLCL